MSVITLKESDLHRIIKNTVTRLLESTDEKSGVIMAEKENEIKEIVDYISNWWEKRRKMPPDGSNPVSAGTQEVGMISFYEGWVAPEVVAKLGIAETHEMTFTIRDMTIDMDKYGHMLSFPDRATGGASYGSDEFMQYQRPSMKFLKSRIELTIPAFNGKLELQGLYSTLYHELNHNMTNLRINQYGFYGKSLANMNRDRVPDKHINMMRALNPEPWTEMGRMIMYGPEGTDKLRAMIFMVYGLWETTERNARAESLYGELYHMRSTPESFEEDFKKTDVYYCIQQFREFVDLGETIPETSNIWGEVGQLVGGTDTKAVKRRFLKRSRELIDILYQKAMKVAKYYFNKQKSAGNQ
jgi:hypothetical protein